MTFRIPHNSKQSFLPTASVFAVLAGLCLGASALSAQAPQSRAARRDSVPAEYRPPAGMCRVWVDGVPPAQQPAPTDCPTASLKRPANSRVIYGDDAGKKKGVKAELPIKGFAPPVKKGAVEAAMPPGNAGFAPRPRAPWENKRITDEQLFGDRPAYTPASSYPGAYPIPYPGAYPGGAGGQPIPPGGGYGTGVLGDPRYFNTSPGVRPPGTGSGVCLDRDQDGWCDDSRFGPPVCLDKDRDGRCDDLPEYASAAYPQNLPHMRSAVDVLEGRPSIEIARWLGTNEFTIRIPDQGSGTTPWRVIFLDAQGELMQVWTDRNRDGIADRIEIFRNGQRVKLIQR
jgi:hypothetical protein